MTESAEAPDDRSRIESISSVYARRGFVCGNDMEYLLKIAREHIEEGTGRG